MNEIHHYSSPPNVYTPRQVSKFMTIVKRLCLFEMFEIVQGVQGVLALTNKIDVMWKSTPGVTRRRPEDAVPKTRARDGDDDGGARDGDGDDDDDDDDDGEPSASTATAEVFRSAKGAKRLVGARAL